MEAMVVQALLVVMGRCRDPQDQRRVGLARSLWPVDALSAASSMPLFQKRDGEAAAHPQQQTAC